ncbi:MAG: EAL domain-containing protein [Magnetococcales bacterium]|nr:EAL domain-containing protein [Magnetococcales bacterium]
MYLWILVVLPAAAFVVSTFFSELSLLKIISDGYGITISLFYFSILVVVSWLAFRTAYSGFALGFGFFTVGYTPKEIRRAIIHQRITRSSRSQFSQQMQQELVTLREKEAKLEMIQKVFSHLTEAVVITDVQGTIASINNAFVDITGFPENEVISQNMRLLKSGRHSASFYIDMWQALLTNGLWTGNIWNRRKNGDVYPQWTVIKAIYDREGGIRNFVGILSDLTDIRESQQQIEFVANYDVLTELPNRILLKDRLSQAIIQAKRHKQLVGLLWVGLDRFKQVNTSGGRLFGDQVLKILAQRLRDGMRENDTIARIGGDEFVLLATQLDDIAHFRLIAEKILQLLGHTLQLGGHTLHFSACIGITVYPIDVDCAESLLKHAETAMHQAKKLGGNTYQFYTQQMGDVAMRRWNTEVGLRRALEHKEFVLFYQPQYDVFTGALVGVEALVRWNSPQFGWVTPDQFIPMAEETGLIVPLGEWILMEACAQNKRWQDAGFPTIQVAVNVSPRQFKSPHLVEAVEKSLLKTGLDAQWLELEITESMFLEDEKRAIEILGQWRRLGLRLAIDDFGTGYSSLSCLRNYPVHSLKIDRSFINDSAHDDQSAAIVKAILAVARGLNLTVVAEGVSSVEQLEFLRQSGCNKVQGFLFSPPIPSNEIVELMQDAVFVSNLHTHANTWPRHHNVNAICTELS